MKSIVPLHDGQSHKGPKAATVGVMKKTPLNDSSVPILKNPAPHFHQQKNNHYQRARKMQWWEIWEQDDHHRGLLPIDEYVLSPFLFPSLHFLTLSFSLYKDVRSYTIDIIMLQTNSVVLAIGHIHPPMFVHYGIRYFKPRFFSACAFLLIQLV